MVQKLLGRALTGFVAGLAIACSTPTKTVVVSNGFHAAAEYYYLSPDEKANLEKKALQGDLPAAKKLVEYHLGYTGDEKQYRRWLTVVARIKNTQNTTGP